MYLVELEVLHLACLFCNVVISFFNCMPAAVCCSDPVSIMFLAWLRLFLAFSRRFMRPWRCSLRTCVCFHPAECSPRSMTERAPFNGQMHLGVNCVLNDAIRNSFGLAPNCSSPRRPGLGRVESCRCIQPCHVGVDWQGLLSLSGVVFFVLHLCFACCLTLCVPQDAAVSAGRGASGEEIEADGIVKGHACSLISAKDVTADGYVWLCAVEL